MNVKCDAVNNYIQKNRYTYLPYRNYQYHAQAILGKLGRVILYFYDGEEYHLLCLSNPYDTNSQVELNYLAHFQSPDGSSWKFNKIQLNFSPLVENLEASVKCENNQVLLHFIYQEKENLHKNIIIFDPQKEWISIEKSSEPLTKVNIENNRLKWQLLNDQVFRWKYKTEVQTDLDGKVKNLLCRLTPHGQEKSYVLEFSNLFDKQMFSESQWQIEDLLDNQTHLYLLMTNEPLSKGHRTNSIQQTALMVLKKCALDKRMKVKKIQLLEAGPDFTYPKLLKHLDNSYNNEFISYIGLMESYGENVKHDLSNHWDGVLTLPRQINLTEAESKLILEVSSPLRQLSVEKLEVKDMPLMIKAESQKEWQQFLQPNHYLNLHLSDHTFEMLYAFDHNHNNSQAFTLTYQSQTKELVIERNHSGRLLTNSNQAEYFEQVFDLAANGSFSELQLELLRDTNSLEIIINSQMAATFNFYELYAGYDLRIKTYDQPLQLKKMEAAKDIIR